MDVVTRGDGESMVIMFSVSGLPQTKGSTKGFVGRSKKTGKLRAFLTNDNPKNKGWAADVAREAKRHAPCVPFAGPIWLELTFRLRKPKRHPRYFVHHTKKPDLDKLTRSIKDALKQGGIYQDDAQVCDSHQVKIYSDEPGVLVTVKEMGS